MSHQENWKTLTFRQSVVNKFDHELRCLISPVELSGKEIENQIFDRSGSQIDYLGLISKIMILIRTKRMTKNEDIRDEIIERIQTQKVPKLLKVMPLSEVAELESAFETRVHQSLADIMEEDN
ncbi:unnamed protein product [Diabrotica balteata]|uniref:Mediator of RNA polymerase II transcription subunit 15 n=1 Tax=Diabrotica balteata TaxID=107213 RepID=A0A9N9T4S0_DIABA|nr:unnamed protein product [Diabrotica balteata]